MLYKRKPRLPLEVVTSPHEEIDEKQQTTEGAAGYAPELDHHMEEMMKWAESVDSKAKANIEKAQKKQKKEYDAKHKPPTFKVGDRVWVYNARKDTRKGKLVLG